MAAFGETQNVTLTMGVASLVVWIYLLADGQAALRERRGAALIRLAVRTGSARATLLRLRPNLSWDFAP